MGPKTSLTDLSVEQWLKLILIRDEYSLLLLIFPKISYENLNLLYYLYFIVIFFNIINGLESMFLVNRCVQIFSKFSLEKLSGLKIHQKYPQQG